MSEVELGGQRYLIGKMSGRTQFHVARRMAPVIKGLVPMFGRMNGANGATLVRDGESGQMVPEGITLFEAVAALTDTIGMMSDTDANYVLDRCLEAVRFRSAERWAPLTAPGGGLMLQQADDLAVQLRLVWEVLVENLGSFSPEKLLSSQTANGQM
jgi:hypothetical protein